MSSPKLTPEEKLELRTEAADVIRQLENTYADDQNSALINRFLNRFNVCETAYKVILKKHQEKKGKSASLRSLKLNMNQVPHALAFAGYNFDRDDLTELFGSKSVEGSSKMTLKNIRNGLTHGINQSVLVELREREAEIFDSMDRFIAKLSDNSPDNDAQH